MLNSINIAVDRLLCALFLRKTTTFDSIKVKINQQQDDGGNGKEQIIKDETQ